MPEVYPRRAITGLIRTFLIGIAGCTVGGIVLHDWRYVVVAGVGVLMVGGLLLVRKRA